MGKTVIIGGNSENLGAILADRLRECVCLSRRTQPSIDALDPNTVYTAFEREKPETVICAATVYPDPIDKQLGSIDDWEDINQLIDVKIKGAYITLNAAVRYGVKNFIFMAGSEVSGDPHFCYFTVANGALWGMTRFANRHTDVNVYYLELGVVLPSRTGERYLSSLACEQKKPARLAAISPSDVVNCVQDIIDEKYPRGMRIVLNNGRA